MKLSNIKHLLVTTILCALTVVTAKAQIIGTYGTDPNTATISASGSTLTINVNGDATEIAGFPANIRDAIDKGDYTDIVVAGGTIDMEVVKAIIFTDEYLNNENQDVLRLDMGTTTCKNLASNTWGIDRESAWRIQDLKLQEFTIPLVPSVDGEIVLPTNAFGVFLSNQNKSLATITIPSGYTKLADNAVNPKPCSETIIETLTTVNLPNTLKTIGDSAFEGIRSIHNVNLPEGLTTIGKAAFKGCTGIVDPVVFPSSLKSILAEAYEGDDQLKNIKLNDGIEFVGNSAFYVNHKVVGNQETISFPSTLKYIGPGAFTGRWFKDVYFYSEIAPVCPVGNVLAAPGTYSSAFDDNIHMGNNGFTPLGLTVGDVLTESNADDIMNGYANRDNYINHDYYLCMLHFPTEVDNANGTADDKAKTYTDITRRYLTKRQPDGSFYASDKLPTGSETECLVYNNGYGWTSTLTAEVNPGYEDTYKGAQYIWPSQSQWMRSFTNNSLGLEWDGVTKYRPTITPEEIALMVEDGLVIKAPNGSAVSITNDATSFTFDATTAAEYNATLPGAVSTSDVKTPAEYYTKDEADTHNLTLEGHIVAGEELHYTTAEINAHNAGLPNAISTSDIKEPAVEAHDAVYYTMDELEWVNGVSYVRSTLVYHDKQERVVYPTWAEYAAANGVAEDGRVSDWFGKEQFDAAYQKFLNGEQGWYFPGNYEKIPARDAYYEVIVSSVAASTTDIKIPAVEAHDAIYYTEEEVNTENAKLPNAWDASTVKGTATAESAAAYNASLPGAWTTATIKTPAVYYTAEEAISHNAGLENAVSAGQTTSTAAAYADELSKVAYLGTRQFVFADGDHAPGHGYPLTDLEPGKWWTICVPFDMTKKMIDDTFGANTHVCLFSAVERDDTPETKHLTLKFQHDVYSHKTIKTPGQVNYGSTFTNSTAACSNDNDTVIYAHESYMIRPAAVEDGGKDAVNYVIPFPEMKAGNPVPTKVNAEDVRRRIAYDEYRFIGNYSTKQAGETGTVDVVVPQYSYMYAKKKAETNYKFWFYTGTTLAWKANKCLVQNTGTAGAGGLSDYENFFSGATAQQAKQNSFFGEEIEDTPTEVMTIVAGDNELVYTNDKVYTINGQFVGNSAKGLSSGIYVVNGKKFFVR